MTNNIPMSNESLNQNPLNSSDSNSIDYRYAIVNGTTMTGSLILSENPTANLQTASKEYTDLYGENLNPNVITNVMRYPALLPNAVVNPIVVYMNQYYDDRLFLVPGGNQYGTTLVLPADESYNHPIGTVIEAISGEYNSNLYVAAGPSAIVYIDNAIDSADSAGLFAHVLATKTSANTWTVTGDVTPD
jgi:hypothetical protein